MIKEKFLRVLYWLRDHFHCLLEVVVRLSLGIEKKQNNQMLESKEDGFGKESKDDSTSN